MLYRNHKANKALRILALLLALICIFTIADPAVYAMGQEENEGQQTEQVQEDNIFVTEEQWERINGKAVVNTETVDSVSDTLTNASLKLNGVSDGMISYNRVVELLLQWYGEKEEF